MKKILALSILSALVLTGCGSTGKSSSSSSETTVAETTDADIETEPILTFRMGTDPNGEIILTEKNVVTAEPLIMQEPNGEQNYGISLMFDEEGKNTFADVTSEAAQNNIPISIWYDGELISSPTVNAPITDGKAIISGDFTLDSATELANKICPDSQKDVNYEGEENE
ncbi:MAG TPA: hypothetical protein P5191_10160 [Ruminococcus sp.]|nr:hypothetical protein [Ruminococcus sp.]